MSVVSEKTLFKEENTPFVMELPPYRMPTLKSTVIHMWEKSRQYLPKDGRYYSDCLYCDMVLGYFP